MHGYRWRGSTSDTTAFENTGRQVRGGEKFETRRDFLLLYFYYIFYYIFFYYILYYYILLFIIIIINNSFI